VILRHHVVPIKREATTYRRLHDFSHVL
jgi:hypothetical protein